MVSRFRVIGLVAAAALAVGWLPATSTAVPRVATAVCTVSVGSVAADGSNRMTGVTSDSPPVAISGLMGRDLYPDGQVRLSGPMNSRLGTAGYEITGLVVLGDVMYTGYYLSDYGTGNVDGSSLTRVGGGWSSFVAFDEAYSKYSTNAYGLRSDGVLFRWSLPNGPWGAWLKKVSYPGFAAVKSMALISQTQTYDTFLANTRGGALYTIHIPKTSPMKPVVKLVRRTTWQVFEALVAERCGQYGTLVVGIDKDGKAAYLYAVGHANGTATVIQNRGKLPVPFGDPVYFHWTNDGTVTQPPFGE
jgi:hypothetical protein